MDLQNILLLTLHYTAATTVSVLLVLQIGEKLENNSPPSGTWNFFAPGTISEIKIYFYILQLFLIFVLQVGHKMKTLEGHENVGLVAGGAGGLGGGG